MSFTIDRTDPARPLIRCRRCNATARHWDDRSASRWKVAHSQGCPGHQPTIDQEEES